VGRPPSPRHPRVVHSVDVPHGLLPVWPVCAISSSLPGTAPARAVVGRCTTGARRRVDGRIDVRAVRGGPCPSRRRRRAALSRVLFFPAREHTVAQVSRQAHVRRPPRGGRSAAVDVRRGRAAAGRRGPETDDGGWTPASPGSVRDDLPAGHAECCGPPRRRRCGVERPACCDPGPGPAPHDLRRCQLERRRPRSGPQRHALGDAAEVVHPTLDQTLTVAVQGRAAGRGRAATTGIGEPPGRRHAPDVHGANAGDHSPCTAPSARSPARPGVLDRSDRQAALGARPPRAGDEAHSHPATARSSAESPRRVCDLRSAMSCAT
jgi:hypothetical protein